MRISPIWTPRIISGQQTLIEMIDQALPDIAEGTVIAITSKIVSICEGNVVPFDSVDKDELIARESDLYLPASHSKYGHRFTITNNTLIAVAGIDESNGEGYYILWPNDAQQTANAVRRYLADTRGLRDIGVVITDSTCQPLRRGTTGIALAHSGFKALRDYVGTPDLFGRPLKLTQANLSGGLAAAAVLAMGEGAERTPLCVMTDLPAIDFQQHDPTPAELAEITVTLQDDLFAPFLQAVPWQMGSRTFK